MFFSILIVTLVALAALASADRRPLGAAYRPVVRVAAVLTVAGATATAFGSGQSAVFSWGLFATTLVAGTYVAFRGLGDRAERQQP